MLKKYNRMLQTLFLISDIVLTNVAFLLAYHIRFTEKYGFFTSYDIPHLLHYQTPLVFITIIWVVNFYCMGLYESKRGKSRSSELVMVIQGVSLGILTLLSLSFFYRSFSYSRVVVLVFFLLNIFLLSLSRLLIRSTLAQFRKRGYNLRRVMIYGAGQVGEAILERFANHPQLGLQVIGFMDDDTKKIGMSSFGKKVFGGVNELTQVLREQEIDQLYLALPLTAHDCLCKVMRIMEKECVDVKYVPDIFQFITLKAGVEDLDGLPVVSISQSPIIGFSYVVKRLFDVVVSFTLLVVLSPVMFLIGALVKFSSKGSVFFAQERMGMDGKNFTMIKFRTMIENAEKETGPVWTTPNDARRTRLGTFLRKTSLDELPQFFNVLKGDMSLVGPRPERPLFVHQFRETLPQYMSRHKVKAGITGWAQVNGWRGNTSIEKRVEHDIFYIDNWSFAFDIRIIMRTIWYIFASEHAY